MRVPNLYHLDVKKDESGSFECKHCGKKFDRRKGYIYHVVNTHTGKSLSEALIFSSTNPQYDDSLFIELQVQYMKILSSNLGRTC